MDTQSRKNSKLRRGIQKKAFTTWANRILSEKERNQSSSEVKDLFKSLRNGHLLGKLLEILTGEKLRRLGPEKSRQQSVDNVEICIDFLEEQRVSTRGIDSEDIVDGCPDTTLELMWAIITGLYINKKELLKKGGEKTVEEALLHWAQEKTKGYRDVRVKDFTGSSWKDGLAFLALINAHRPAIIDFREFHNGERRYNLRTAFEEAEDELGIPSLLDVEDLMKYPVDERAVAAYIACVYKRFADSKPISRNSRSRSDSRSDTSSSSETSSSSGRKSPSPRSSRNKHKHRGNSESSSRTSSTTSNSSDRSTSERGSRNRNVSGRTRSSSDEGNAGKMRPRNRNEEGRRRSVSHERSKGDAKRRSISPVRRKKVNKTEMKSGRRSNSRVRERNPDRSLSRTRNRRERRTDSCDREYRSERRLSRTRKQRDRRTNSRNREYRSERSLSRTRKQRDRRTNSRDREYRSERSLSRTRNRRAGRSNSREKKRSYSNSPGRRVEKKRDDRRRYEMSPESRRDRDKYRGDVHLRERRRSYSRGRNRSSSNSDHDNEYPRDTGARFYTLGRSTVNKQGKIPDSPSLPTDWAKIQEEIRRPRRHGRVEIQEALDFLGFPHHLNISNIPTVPPNPSPVQFEWQFQDEHGVWITYGKPNSSGNVSQASTTTSNDIENYFVVNPTGGPVLVRTKNNCYELNFEKKTQTNQKTRVQRPIRRIPKLSANITPINANFNPNVGIFPGTIPSAVPSSLPQAKFEWQFEDEHGSWIPYGKPNSAGNVAHATTTSSDDIERHYASNQTNPTPLTITSNNNSQYVLDFVNMIQTNQHTSVTRNIKRVPKSSPTNTAAPKGNTFVWSFKDEHGNWIKYGETNSSNQANFATSTTSDDIEMRYAQNPSGALEIASGQHKYIIDFKTMKQTNIDTKNVRDIQRKVVSPNDLPSNWTAMKPSDKGLSLVLLSSTDPEYMKQDAFVKKTLPTNHKITKLFRIQNEHLFKDFLSRKNRLKERNPQIQYKEMYLFHGTDPTHVQSICAENLDFRLNGTNGTVYGKGTYFATSAAYSARYAGSGATKVMFIVKVLIGQYTVGSSNLRRPPKDASGVFYDATVDNASNPTIYVKYDNTEYYPEYYFEFT